MKSSPPTALLRLGTVVAAGVWSGGLLSSVTGQPRWAELLQPRRGHLLEVPRPDGMPLITRGMMEMSYTKHYSKVDVPPRSSDGSLPPHEDLSSVRRSGAIADVTSDPVDITFTATTSASGSLLIGSSREFSGFTSEPDSDIVEAVMTRATGFLPALAGVPLPQGDDVRVGLRPYAVGGLPLVGPVPGLPGFVVAAGHEGSGLCLGPATARLVCQYLLGERVEGGLTIDRFKELLPAVRYSELQS